MAFKNTGNFTLAQLSYPSKSSLAQFMQLTMETLMQMGISTYSWVETYIAQNQVGSYDASYGVF